MKINYRYYIILLVALVIGVIIFLRLVSFSEEGFAKKQFCNYQSDEESYQAAVIKKDINICDCLTDNKDKIICKKSIANLDLLKK